MVENQRVINLNGSKTEAEIELEKQISLIRILKDQEEFLLDREGVIISSNLEAVNVTGYEEHEVLGRKFSLFYLPEEQHKANADLQKAEKLGQVFVSGLKMKKRGGKFWAKMKITAIRSNGLMTYKVWLKDATHRALSNFRVRTIKDEYLAIFNNPFVGTFKFRMSDFHMLMCNQKTAEILGRNCDGATFKSFFGSDEQFFKFVSLLKTGKKVEGFEFLIAQESQTDNWALLSARYFETRGFVEGVLLDITEQHRQTLDLKRVNKELDRFIYHASHDFRAPLTSILGLINLAKCEASIDEINSYMEMIKGRVNHLDSLLRDLTLVSYNSSSETGSAEIDLKSEVFRIVKAYTSPCNPVKVDLKIRCHTRLVTDATRVLAIIRNLLANALQYYSPDIAQPLVTLTINVYSTQAEILLKDNGIGIDERFHNNIFEMFFKGTDRSKGNGLGLYIVKSMVEKLNGQIRMQSVVNKGTTFIVMIPNLLKHK
jgi:PAS domain S-box-containing protein